MLRYPVLGTSVPDAASGFICQLATYAVTWALSPPVEDIAHAILFVVPNPYSTGSTVIVDGGSTIVGRAGRDAGQAGRCPLRLLE